ncbi:hypothetical protein ANN_26570 [Periplaneta americana]|uniref:Uncharacterized protein n=1 Tax=Periplaneta americana TaxID=6978 RepID=A0ABQ8RZ53_PERAM|nr:hypothetical protein ANN_26570 [Periplaneta americana]
MSPGSSTESYPAFARIGLRETPGKNLNQVICSDRDSNPGHLVSQPDTLTVTPQRKRAERMRNYFVYERTSTYAVTSHILRIRIYVALVIYLSNREIILPDPIFPLLCKVVQYAGVHTCGVTVSASGCKTRIPTRNTILRWVASFRITGSTLKKKSPGRNSIALRLSEATVQRSARCIQLVPLLFKSLYPSRLLLACKPMLNAYRLICEKEASESPSFTTIQKNR